MRVTSIPLRASTVRSAFAASLARLTPCSVSPGRLAPAAPASASAPTTESEIDDVTSARRMLGHLSAARGGR